MKQLFESGPTLAGQSPGQCWRDQSHGRHRNTTLSEKFTTDEKNVTVENADEEFTTDDDEKNRAAPALTASQREYITLGYPPGKGGNTFQRGCSNRNVSRARPYPPAAERAYALPASSWRRS